MYGPGTAPPPLRPAGRAAVVIGLRVLFTVLPAITLGIAAWGSVLWLAVRFRRPLDWVLVPFVAAIAITAFVLIGQAEDENSTQSNIGGGCLMFCMFAVPVYFLVVDLQQSSKARRLAGGAEPFGRQQPYFAGPVPGTVAGPVPGTVTGPVPGRISGQMPGRVPGRTAGPIPGAPVGRTNTGGTTGREAYGYPQQPRPHRPPAPAGLPGPPVPPVPQAGPPHPRISQVRAELDELSDYLRKEEDR
ncbi:hypothetical protein [Streptomyces sp. NBC_01190]|uniref:hypothetical protein n=1 Tax=Streptomyces sp. NBC_01190 TaxID=2903767 RepID=UPI00386A5D24|nr:hypothetical protein OG519_12110 [Streptomyces sp. NBC_01190]